ncbi:synaptobrevin family protein [Cryptosporidium muris RN66]|uniref:Synaptobrevin family protein n=1 Tax=Cryptosporidium muris (strain RN66) TaxID=441375 RepID=B6ABP2_CRYMR|nr:synaptobrevin family protein [Cryptosporidium muris RN66]EEA05794.1 synaptobrevin family protein [Cryptosporidium muris RN66]|eukprot:XP_002140143.1 synaptobrevin family protein [Cryptosporidium muris RN66]
MPLIYSLIARKQTVLAEYTESIGNFSSIARLLLKHINNNKAVKQTYTYDQYCFHYIISDTGIMFMVMTEKDFSIVTAYEYLYDIIESFKKFEKLAINSVTLGLNNEFSPILKSKMEYWNLYQLNEYDKLMSQISSIQHIMIDNIDILLDRQDKLDLLVSQTKNLTSESNNYHRQSRRFHNTAKWCARPKIIFFFITLCFSLYLIAVFQCKGFLLQGCFNKTSNTNIEHNKSTKNIYDNIQYKSILDTQMLDNNDSDIPNLMEDYLPEINEDISKNIQNIPLVTSKLDDFEIIQ